MAVGTRRRGVAVRAPCGPRVRPRDGRGRADVQICGRGAAGEQRCSHAVSLSPQSLMEDPIQGWDVVGPRRTGVAACCQARDDERG
eukprot:4448728-Prymnesium_polylepis.1